MDASTKDRILTSAVGLFASQGYAATSVRQICEAAGANVASVNYHFGSKRGLYDASLDYARARSNEANPWVDLDTDRDFWSGHPPLERLEYFVAMLIDHTLTNQGKPSDLSRMMIHEMLDPTPAFERQIELSIGRVFDALVAICRDNANPNAKLMDVRRVAMLVSAQCLYPALIASAMPDLYPGLRFDKGGRKRLAGTIASNTFLALQTL